MQTSDSMIYGDRLFEGDSDFHGMIKGDATIAPRATVRLHGMVKGDVTVSPEARLEMVGMIKGDLTLGQGAHVLVTGMVAGDIVNQGGTVDFG